MENAANALKYAMGVLIFALASMLLFRIASLAREVSTILIAEADKTTYYTYYEVEEGKLDNEGRRIVSLAEMIPMIYRYSTESMGVTIIDNGEIVARFDMQTEETCNNWVGGRLTESQKNTFLGEINTYVLEPVGARKLDNTAKLQELFEKIYKRTPAGINTQIFGCEWRGNDAYKTQRIDSDLYGVQVFFSTANAGVNENNSSLGNHVPYFNKGIIGEYKDNKFKEYMVIHDTNEYVEEDGEKLFTVQGGINSGSGRQVVKREIIYVKQA